MTAAYQELTSKLVTWGSIDNNLRAMIIVGSRARYPEPDLNADLDLILFTLNSQEFARSQPWLSILPKPWISTHDYTSQGDSEWVMIYGAGLKLDMVISNTDPENDLASMLANSSYQEVLRRGYRILLDKTGGSGPKAYSDIRPFQTPDVVIFEETIDRTLIAILRAAKFTRRGDLWRAQLLLGTIRRNMLQFIEWHTLLSRTTEVDIWYDGRDINTWADPRVEEMLPRLFPGYQQKEISESLSASLKLLNQLSLVIAQKLDFAFPNEGQANLVAWLYQLI